QALFHLLLADTGQLTPRRAEHNRRIPQRAERLLDDEGDENRPPIDRKRLHDAPPRLRRGAWPRASPARRITPGQRENFLYLMRSGMTVSVPSRRILSFS